MFSFLANRDFAGLLEVDRIRRVREKSRREALGPTPALNPVADPNLEGYKFGVAARPIESHLANAKVIGTKRQELRHRQIPLGSLAT